MAETKIALKQREAVTFQFTVIDKNTQQPVNLTGASGITYTIKNSPFASSALVSKAVTGTIDGVAVGIVSCTLDQDDLNLSPGLYYSELFLDIAAANRRKSQTILLDIAKSIT